MARQIDPELAIKMTTEIAVAYLNKNVIKPTEISALIRDIREALESGAPDLAEEQSTSAATASEGLEIRSATHEPAACTDTDMPSAELVMLRPAVPIGESVTNDYIISLEDGRHFRSLRRHLMTKYGMTPDDYRRKWGLAADYPMVAPSYALERSEVAKRTGLGHPTKKPLRLSRKRGII